MPDIAPAATPPAAPAGKMENVETHIKVIGILDVVFGGLAGLIAVMILFMFSLGSAITGAARDAGVPGWMPGVLTGLGLFAVLLVGVFAALFLLAGIGLLQRRRSSRMWGIVAACAQLVSFPFGTALGIYALVILTRPQVEQVLVNP